MKRLLIAASLALAIPLLPACTMDQAGQVQSASKKAVIAANDFYTHASRSGLILVNQGLMDRAKYKKLDADAYAILLKIRLGQATFDQLAAAAKPLFGGQ